MLTEYKTETENRLLYAGSNYYMAVEYFKWACANGFRYVALKQKRTDEYADLKIFSK